MSLGIQNDVDRLMLRLKEAGVVDADVLSIRQQIDRAIERAALSQTKPETPSSRSSQRMQAVNPEARSSKSSQSMKAIILDKDPDGDDD